MFERFTDRARKIMAFANMEALRRGDPAIDTEHILLAITIERTNVAAVVLESLPPGLVRIHDEVTKSMGLASQDRSHEKLPQTRNAKKVLEHAINETASLNHKYVGTEHLLLGLLQNTDGKASQLLNRLGITTEQTPAAILKYLEPFQPDAPPLEFLQPASPNSILYRSPVDLRGGPSLKHIFAGMASGFLLLPLIGVVVLAALIGLRALIGPRWILSGFPQPDHPVITLLAIAFMLILCLSACWVMVRLTIRQFSRRHLK